MLSNCFGNHTHPQLNRGTNLRYLAQCDKLNTTVRGGEDRVTRRLYDQPNRGCMLFNESTIRGQFRGRARERAVWNIERAIEGSHR